MTTKKKAIRQGDVIIVLGSQKANPEIIHSLSEKDKFQLGTVEQPLVLARGEVTGHTHRLVLPLPEQNGKQTTKRRPKGWDSGETDYSNRNIAILEKDSKLHVFEECILIHEEHGPQTIPPGIHELKIQREYEPEGWRKVAD